MAFKAVRYLDGGTSRPVEFLVNDSQTILRGYLLQVTGGKVSVCGDAQGAGTVAGVAMEAITTTTATASDTVLVDTNTQAVYNAPYTTASTADCAIGTAYDLGANAGTVDADDSTGGYIRCIGNVDTTNNTADFMLDNRVNNVG